MFKYLFSFVLLSSICFSQIIVNDTSIIGSQDYLRNTSLLLKNNNFYLYGFSGTPFGIGIIDLIKLDSKFEQKWETVINYSKATFSDLIYSNKNNQINLLSITGAGFDKLTLAAVDTNGKIIYQIDTNNIINNYIYPATYCNLINYDNKIYHFSSSGADSTSNILLHIFDSLGINISKEKIYIISNKSYNELLAVSAVQTRDSGYVVIGVFEITKNNYYDMFLHKYSKEKKLIWEKIFKNDSLNHIPDNIMETENGDLIVVGRYIPKHYNDRNYSQFLKKFDPSGNLIWERNHFKKVYTDFSKIYLCPSGNFYETTGIFQMEIVNPPDNYFYFGLVKYDSSGNLIWQKTWGKDSVQNQLRDAAIISENEIVVSGSQDIYTYVARIKDTTLTDIYQEEPKEKNINLLYPNPVSDFIFLPISILNLSDKIEIYSIDGKCILITELKSRVDLSSLSSGTYFLKIGPKIFKFSKL